MVTIKRLSECTFEQGAQIWNEGFQGYFFDMNTTVDAFTARLGSEGLSPRLSVVAFTEGRPVGFILNGVRQVGDKKIAWNGGTGVAPEFRGHGVGRAMMQASLDIYREEQVNFATLEAISQNETAIALYQKMGYQLVDRLAVYNREGAFEQAPFQTEGQTEYMIRQGIPIDISHLPFYRSLAAWQTQWASVRDGQSLTVFDATGKSVGYAIYKRTFDQTGNVVALPLYQCEAAPGHPDTERILRLLLAAVYTPWDLQVRRVAFNIPFSNPLVIQLLEQAGFALRAELVYMVREM